MFLLYKLFREVLLNVLLTKCGGTGLYPRFTASNYGNLDVASNHHVRESSRCKKDNLHPKELLINVNAQSMSGDELPLPATTPVQESSDSKLSRKDLVAIVVSAIALTAFIGTYYTFGYFTQSLRPFNLSKWEWATIQVHLFCLPTGAWLLKALRIKTNEKTSEKDDKNTSKVSFY